MRYQSGRETLAARRGGVLICGARAMRRQRVQVGRYDAPGVYVVVRHYGSRGVVWDLPQR